jgi:hypothetical protein
MRQILVVALVLALAAGLVAAVTADGSTGVPASPTRTGTTTPEGRP